MKLQIDDQIIELLDLETDYATLNQVQAETYRLLYALACIEGLKGIRIVTLSRLLGLRSPAPLTARLANLQAKGKIRLVSTIDEQIA